MVFFFVVIVLSFLASSLKVLVILGVTQTICLVFPSYLCVEMSQLSETN